MNPEQFIEELKKTKNSYQAVSGFCQKTLKFLKANYSMRSYKTKVSTFRTALKKSNAIDTSKKQRVLKYFNTDMDIIKRINKEYNADLSNNAHHLVTITQHELEQKIFPRFLECLQNPNCPKWELSIALAFFTGRRHSEIMQSGTIDLLDDDDERYIDHVAFKGQKKTKHDDIERPINIIPVLGEASLIVQRWNDLIKMCRSEFKDLDYEAFNNRAKTGRTQFHVKFSDIEEKIKNIKGLRALYAAINLYYNKADYEEYTGEYITDNAYVAMILGHSENDLNTANSYQKIKIIE